MNQSLMKTASARKDRLIQEHNHDPYKSRRKLPEPSVCPSCKAVFRAGRWQWMEAWPLDAHQEICQACRRIKDNYPAGLVTLRGGARHDRHTEMINLIRNVEQAEKADHPLHRIMKIEHHADTVVVTTTNLHLARRLGEAVHHAYKGKLDWHYDKESCFARLNWAPE